MLIKSVSRFLISLFFMGFFFLRMQEPAFADNFDKAVTIVSKLGLIMNASGNTTIPIIATTYMLDYGIDPTLENVTAGIALLREDIGITPNLLSMAKTLISNHITVSNDSIITLPILVSASVPLNQKNMNAAIDLNNSHVTINLDNVRTAKALIVAGVTVNQDNIDTLNTPVVTGVLVQMGNTPENVAAVVALSSLNVPVTPSNMYAYNYFHLGTVPNPTVDQIRIASLLRSLGVVLTPRSIELEPILDNLGILPNQNNINALSALTDYNASQSNPDNRLPVTQENMNIFSINNKNALSALTDYNTDQQAKADNDPNYVNDSLPVTQENINALSALTDYNTDQQAKADNDPNYVNDKLPVNSKNIYAVSNITYADTHDRTGNLQTITADALKEDIQTTIQNAINADSHIGGTCTPIRDNFGSVIGQVCT